MSKPFYVYDQDGNREVRAKTKAEAMDDLLDSVDGDMWDLQDMVEPE